MLTVTLQNIRCLLSARSKYVAKMLQCSIEHVNTA